MRFFSARSEQRAWILLVAVFIMFPLIVGVFIAERVSGDRAREELLGALDRASAVRFHSQILEHSAAILTVLKSLHHLPAHHTSPVDPLPRTRVGRHYHSNHYRPRLRDAGRVLGLPTRVQLASRPARTGSRAPLQRCSRHPPPVAAVLERAFATNQPPNMRLKLAGARGGGIALPRRRAFLSAAAPPCAGGRCARSLSAFR